MATFHTFRYGNLSFGWQNVREEINQICANPSQNQVYQQSNHARIIIYDYGLLLIGFHRVFTLNRVDQKFWQRRSSYKDPEMNH